MNFLPLLLAGLLIENYVVVQFLGICPFLGMSKKMDSALGMGLAVTFVMVIASLVTYPLYTLMESLGLAYLQIIVLILVIAALVQIIEVLIKRFTPSLYRAMGIYLPLITTNCAVLGVAVLNLTNPLVVGSTVPVLSAVLSGLFSGLGFTLAIVILAGIREKLDKVDVGKNMKGFPIVMTTACLMAMAFYVFNFIG